MFLLFCGYRYLKNKNTIDFEVPSYFELSPKNAWPRIKDNKDFTIYFPDIWDLQILEKKFLCVILSTIWLDGVREMITIWLKNLSLVLKRRQRGSNWGNKRHEWFYNWSFCN